MRKRVYLILAVVAVTTILASVFTVATKGQRSGPVESLGYPALAAHRGGKLVNPESTMKAFRDIRDNHPDMLIEMDVHQLKTGELVIWHDKTANGSPIYELTAAQWRKVRVPDQDGGTQPAPFLNEVLDEFGHTDSVLVIELKAEQAINDFVEELWPYRDNVITQTFNADLTSRLVRSGFKAMQLSSSWQPPLVEGAYAVGVKESLMTDETIKRFQDAGQYVWAWTVDDQNRMSELFSMGVDGVMTNDPRLTVT